ncbi:uncharacterized protein LOC110109522 [Dendrobium catenatum]|uniref:uncharacterized protein LOC110109522 n=1 Tax=Dendrobium catenatum TaxID=906689 RepID=UPI0009F5A203|nr:uncharacterized protein LOC110109522 [Dendrobium catenatum]
MASIAFWNCRAKKSQASLYLREFVKEFDAFIVGLLETKISSIDRKGVHKLIGMDWDFDYVLADGLSGGILILWNSKVSSFNVLESFSQGIIGDLDVFNKGVWRISNVYGSNDIVKRRELWRKVEQLSSKDLPSVAGGDFNCLLDSGDKRGGREFSFSQGSKEMKSFLINNDFHDVGFIGPRITWCNNKTNGARILKRLDRCFLNSKAIEVISMGGGKASCKGGLRPLPYFS